MVHSPTSVSAAESPVIDPLDRIFALPMWLVSLTSLTFLAGGLHLHSPDDPESSRLDANLMACILGSCVVYPVYWAELLIRWQAGQTRLRQYVWCCLLPPLRLGVRDAKTGQLLWLPGWGWSRAGDRLEQRIQKAIGGPMLAISLSVLPLILAELHWNTAIKSSPLLTTATQIATGLIWLVFTIEFVVMFSATNRKVQYCKEHWVDLAIILLPLLAFCRMLRLGGLLRYQTQFSRAYRLRGVLARGWRALLVLNAIQRLIAGPPARRCEKLRMLIAQKEAELSELRVELEGLEPAPAVGVRRAA